MKIVNLAQGTPEWLVWRAQGMTGSDAPIIMGQSPYSTPWRLWCEKKGRIVRHNLDRNPNVIKGRREEDNARRTCEEGGMGILLPACVESDENPVMRASLDGLDANGIPVEIKVCSGPVLRAVIEQQDASETVAMYKWQVIHQALVVGATHGLLIFYDADQRQIAATFHVDATETLKNELEGRAMEFWEALQKDKEPRKDVARDIFVPTGADVSRWAEAVSTMKDLEERIAKEKEAIGIMNAQFEEQKAALINMMGDFMCAESMGIHVTRTLAAGPINYKKAIDELAPDLLGNNLDKYRGQGHERVRVYRVDKDEQPKGGRRVTQEWETDALNNVEQSFYF